MKLHLPVLLLRSLVTLFSPLAISVCVVTAFSVTSYGDIVPEINFLTAEKEYHNGSVTYTKRQSSAFTLSDYERIIFKSTTSGAIYNYSDSFDLSTNGEITFLENSAAIAGGAIYCYYTSASLVLNDNERVVFQNNSATSVSSRGGAFCVDESATVTLGNNGSVSFEGNSATYGGAIHNSGTNASFMLFGSKSLIFTANSATSKSYGYGGAIYNSSEFSLIDNESVIFRKNLASTSTYDARGGAIYNSGVFSLSENHGNVTFSNNQISSSGTSDAAGGAIHNYSKEASFVINKNANIVFSFNEASTLAPSLSASGGAISNTLGSFTLKENESVNFCDNTVFSDSGSAFGGAVSHTSGRFVINDNGSVIFSKNTVSSNSIDAYGGAIGAAQGDGSVVFELNNNGGVVFSENSSSNRGGAIDNGALFKLCSNRSVSFSDNFASMAARGGSINNFGNFLCSDNGDVVFCRNSASHASSIIYGGAIYNSGTFSLSENGLVSFEENSGHSTTRDVYGGGIFNTLQTFSLNSNKSVTFKNNSVEGFSSYGGAIYTGQSGASFKMNDNGSVSFSGNSASSHAAKNGFYDGAFGGAVSNQSGAFSLNNNESVLFENCSAAATFNNAYGGAIYNYGTQATLSLNGNECTVFNGNFATSASYSSYGGAIYNRYGTVLLSGATEVAFNKNSVYTNSSYAYGGAVYNENGVFYVSGNGNITFSENLASAENSYYVFDSCGGAVYNNSQFSLEGNGHVLFEKNVERGRELYRLRSIYSTGTLNLASSEGKSITFRDTIYASGTLNLNHDYTDSEGVTHQSTGSIIFTGETTEADLREVKGGIDGTAEEIMNSRTSEIATNAKLYGGRLVVEEGAILKGRGVTVMEDANATIRLNNGTLNEAGYAVSVSSGSGLEFEGVNSLTAFNVSMVDGSFMNFVLGAADTMVDWNADLNIGGALTLNLQNSTDTLLSEYSLISMQGINTLSGWNTETLSVRGASAEHLVWENNTLYYRPMLVHEDGTVDVEKDVTLDDGSSSIGGLDDVTINGNSHSLTVKNAVQLVQMALQNGTVKLEGENNNVVSITLKEDGSLVLAAGAGLKTGDIISMVANGSGELVISGDITIDEHGMKGNNGGLANISYMDAKTTGDAVFENVSITDSVLDIGEGTKAIFRNVVLGSGTYITDAPAFAELYDVHAILDHENTTVEEISETTADLRLYMSGKTNIALTLNGGSTVTELTCTVFDTITLSGSDLYLDLTALALTLGDADVFSLTFTNGTLAAIDTKSLRLYATLDGENYLEGYTTQKGGLAGKVYFSASLPEPATTSLSLLALAALVTRRKRKE